jgi:molecular chaperone GrpE
VSSDPSKAREDGAANHAAQAPEAELPQAPPGAHASVPEPAPAAAVGKEPELAAEPAKPEPEQATPEVDAAGVQTEPAPADLDVLTAKAQKADEYLALAQRTQADFENYRRRAVREAKNAQERGAVKLALELLPAIDNLERALAHIDGTEAVADGNGTDSLVAGIKHVHSDVVAALGRAGIESYFPEGERFDPQFHEAVAQQPVEGAEPGVVVEVFQRGYRMGDNVVRPARVVVAG